jgi:LacI family transcriptional regulator
MDTEAHHLTCVYAVQRIRARSFPSGQAGSIPVVLDVANLFFTDLARGVEDEAGKAGLAVILGSTDYQAGKERRCLELLEEHRVPEG